MSVSLYEAVIPTNLQMLRAMAILLDKADAYCVEKNLAPTELIAARFATDMMPFAYQVKSVAVHSQGAIEGVRAGVFSPDETVPPSSFAGLKARIDEAIDALDRIDMSEMESFVGREMQFCFGERCLDFTAENFLLSFSQPNFHFHAATAYGLLRWKGMPIGKRDYTGLLRTRGR
jgi:uncharacterized protein